MELNSILSKKKWGGGVTHNYLRKSKVMYATKYIILRGRN